MRNGSTLSPLEARTRLWRSVASAIDEGMSCHQAGLHFHLSERTVYRILGRRLPSGKVRRARRPGPKPGTGPGMTSPAMVQLVCEWKREHPEKGHAYCHHLLKRQGLNPPAPVTIWRLWRKRNLLGTKRRRQSRSRWHQLREQGAGFFQLDTMYLPGDRFAFCAIDTLSRYAYGTAAALGRAFPPSLQP